MKPLAGWGRVFGPALAFSLALQAVTGLCMASFYAPSSTTAWAAVAYIQQEVTLGWFIRGLHSAGASMTVTAVLWCVAVIGLGLSPGLLAAYAPPGMSGPERRAWRDANAPA